jgi:hypothetical protein
MTAREFIAKEIRTARAAIRRKAKAGGAVGTTGEPATVPAAVAAAAGQEAIHVRLSIASIGTHTLVAGASGKRIAVYELMLYNVASQDLELKDGSNSLTGPLTSFPATSGMLLHNCGEPHFILSPGEDLNLTTSAADQVSGFLLYRMLEV